MNIFKNQEMTWKKVWIVTFLSAILTALCNCIPFLEDTSFTAPAISYEMWVLLALYIILNCKGYKEAMLKTFVFFLVSQPLIYLLEVPFKAAGWELFNYYPFWGMMTILTIPGSAIAYRVKKDDVLSAIILSIANFLILMIGFSWMKSMIDYFPRHTLATAFCFILPFFFIFTIFENKKTRIIAVLLNVLILAYCTCTQVLFEQDVMSGYPLEEGNWTLVESTPKGLNVTVDNNRLNISTHKNGDYTIVLTDESGNTIIYNVNVSGANHYIEATMR